MHVLHIQAWYICEHKCMFQISYHIRYDTVHVWCIYDGKLVHVLFIQNMFTNA